MPDVQALLRRDHEELDQALLQMTSPTSTESELHDSLVAVRMGLAAHAEAEGLMIRAMLDTVHPPALVYLLCSQVIAAHLTQEGALAALEGTRPGSTAWLERALHLRNLIGYHDQHEAACVVPALRDYLPSEVYGALAGSYASARLRALGTLPLELIAS